MPKAFVCAAVSFGAPPDDPSAFLGPQVVWCRVGLRIKGDEDQLSRDKRSVAVHLTVATRLLNQPVGKRRALRGCGV